MDVVTMGFGLLGDSHPKVNFAVRYTSIPLVDIYFLSPICTICSNINCHLHLSDTLFCISSDKHQNSLNGPIKTILLLICRRVM